MQGDHAYAKWDPLLHGPLLVPANNISVRSGEIAGGADVLSPVFHYLTVFRGQQIPCRMFTCEHQPILSPSYA